MAVARIRRRVIRGHILQISLCSSQAMIARYRSNPGIGLICRTTPRRALGHDTGWRPSQAARPDKGTLVVALPAEAQQSSLGYHGIAHLYGRAQLPRQMQAYSWWSFYFSSCSRFSSRPVTTSSSPVPRRYKGIDRNAAQFFRSFRILHEPARFNQRLEGHRL